MGVFTAKYHVGDNQFPLGIEHFEVVGYRHEVHFGRQFFVVGVTPPVGRREDTELAAFYNLFNLVLNRFEVCGGGLGEFPGIGLQTGVVLCEFGNFSILFEDIVLDFRRLNGVGFERLYGRNPVERVQVVEVHQVVVDVKGAEHYVPDVVGVFGNLDIQSVFYRPNRCERVDSSADTAYPLGECPRIPGVSTPEYYLDTTPHGGGGNGVHHLVLLFVNGNLQTEVTFYSGNGVNNYPLSHLLNLHLLSNQINAFPLRPFWRALDRRLRREPPMHLRLRLLRLYPRYRR